MTCNKLQPCEAGDAMTQIQEGDWVNVGRPGPFGNPFKVGAVYQGVKLTREQAVAVHKNWFLYSDQGAALQEKVRLELRGKKLWCPGCKSTLPCHRTILEEVANAKHC